MEKITLKLYDFLQLEAELNGARNQATGEVVAKGLLQQSLPMGTKYWLTKLAKTIGEEKAIIDSLRDELIKKHGSETAEGNVSVDLTITELDEDGKPVMVAVKLEDGSEKKVEKKVINPAFLAFEKEYQEVLSQEKELEFRAILLSELSTHDHPNGISLDENYDIFFEHIVVESK